MMAPGRLTDKGAAWKMYETLEGNVDACTGFGRRGPASVEGVYSFICSSTAFPSRDDGSPISSMTEK
jgi:hypothetical protein